MLFPVYPNSAADAVAPLLEPAFGHYVRQWDRIALPDPEQTDAMCFYFQPSEVPDRIADPANANALADAARPFFRAEDLEWFEDGEPTVLWSERGDWGVSLRIRSNIDDLCVHASRKGVKPFPPGAWV